MPVMYDFLDDVLFLSLVGASAHGDSVAAVKAALTERERTPLRGIIVDSRLSSSIGDRTPSQVRAIADELGAIGDGFGRRIALIGATDLSFGVLRMGEAHMQNAGLDARTFRHEAEAIRWINRREPWQVTPSPR